MDAEQPTLHNRPAFVVTLLTFKNNFFEFAGASAIPVCANSG